MGVYGGFRHLEITANLDRPVRKFKTRESRQLRQPGKPNQTVLLLLFLFLVRRRRLHRRG
jgi:hypothetical protein